jgi:hypothetical protein
MVGQATKALTWVLIALISTLGMAASSRHAFVEWWAVDGSPKTVLGLTLWQPRLGEYLKWNEDQPDAYDGEFSNLKKGLSLRCSRLRDILADEGLLHDFVNSGYRVQKIFYPCLVMALLHQGKPAPIRTFDAKDLISDIEKRLDLKSFRSSFGPSLSGIPSPVFFQFFIREGAESRIVITKEQSKYMMLSRWEGRDSWYREIALFAAADWTGDGSADLLVIYTDQGLYDARYLHVAPMILTADSKTGHISAIWADDWIADHREELLEALGDVLK